MIMEVNTDTKNYINNQAVVEATEEDISNIITSDNVIEVEGNGNIVFENENKSPIPSEVEYQVKVGV